MNTNKQVIILVGAPASGKSSHVEPLRGYNSIKVISTDEYRKEMFGSLKAGNTPESNQKLFPKINQDIRRAVADDSIRNIIYDATNTHRKRRRALYSNIKSWANEEITVKIKYFSMPLSTILERNEMRKDMESYVPPQIVKRLYLNMQVPRIGSDCDEFEVISEPMFKPVEIKFDGNESGEIFLAKFISNLDPSSLHEIINIYTPHDCAPHHLETVNEHISMCIENAHERIENGGMRSEVFDVAIFHDLGKGITKQMITKDGVTKAIYRGHADVSANYFLNYIHWLPNAKIEDHLDTMEAIHQHMNYHQGIGDKNKRNNKLNDKTLDICKQFGIIDNISKIVGRR